MEAQLREMLGEELRRRHGFGMMGDKIKPVHVANGLFREEHQIVGSMRDLKQLMTATAPKETPKVRLEAAELMLERNRERWGRLGEVDNLRDSTLMTRVLPLLRTLLGTDNAVYGTSPEFSSFSSASALTISRDVSDDHAGSFVHRLWGGQTEDRLSILNLLRELTNAERDLAGADDLTAVLAPLTDDPVPLRAGQPREFVDLVSRPLSDVEQNLRKAAGDLDAYERAVKPNPIATIQRIVLLASISLFFHCASRGRDWAGIQSRVLLIDSSSSRHSMIAAVSEQHVSALLNDSRLYLATVLETLLNQHCAEWVKNPVSALVSLLHGKVKGTVNDSSVKKYVTEILEDLGDSEGEIKTEFPKRIVDLIDGSGGKNLDVYLRVLGMRCGLLYPQQKNPHKRLVPMDRTLEVIVASTFNIAGRQIEYRDFLELLYRRWGMVTGGRLEDGALLADAGSPISSTDLAENSERFLSRLQSLGLAARRADSVAVVGLMESGDAP